MQRRSFLMHQQILIPEKVVKRQTHRNVNQSGKDREREKEGERKRVLVAQRFRITNWYIPHSHFRHRTWYFPSAWRKSCTDSNSRAKKKRNTNLACRIRRQLHGGMEDCTERGERIESTKFLVLWSFFRCFVRLCL